MKPLDLTQAALYDRDGAVQCLNSRAVLKVQAVGQAELVVGLCEQTAVRLQVLHLQLQTLLEVLQGLCVVSLRSQR